MSGFVSSAASVLGRGAEHLYFQGIVWFPGEWVWTAAAVALAALATFSAVLWLRAQHERRAGENELQKMRTALGQREQERDLAQKEVFRRLYEERELNKEKAQFQAQLAEYEKYAALARLALGAAHEINNPLLGILSHLELELNATTEAETRAEIEQCIAGAKRISNTLRGLVNYARPGPLVLSKISLYRLVCDTLGFLEGQPMLRGKTLENSVPSDLPHIRADANQLSQVLMNLLLNAAEATPEGGSIAISASKLTYVDSLEIRVSDTGCGIPADVLPHVFEPFFTTKKGKGTGLGLSISQAYLRSHGGEMRVDSVVNHGTTVTLTLPVRQEGAEAEEAEAEVVV
ncbi:MAG TPA: ATP-binding protein [Terriglobales bacterium]|nr:ATP-binding protein [Terriglobales bacterium]